MPRPGTRASARLRGEEAELVQEPAPPVEPENERTNRKRKPNNKDKTVKLPKKKPKSPESTPVQTKTAPLSKSPPVEPVIDGVEEDDPFHVWDIDDHPSLARSWSPSGPSVSGGDADADPQPQASGGIKPRMIELSGDEQPPPEYVRVERRYYIRTMADGSKAVALGLFPVEDPA